MEGKEIYQASYDEIVNIRKAIGSTRVIINFDKLDAESQTEIRSALLKATSARQSAILNVLGNANSGV